MKKITTLTQLFYYLQNGEIIAWKMQEGECYLTKEDNKYKVIMQPKFGSSKELWAYNNEQVEGLYQYLKDNNVDLWVFPGAILQEKELTLFEKLVDYFRN